jgi:hypothetical protein
MVAFVALGEYQLAAPHSSTPRLPPTTSIQPTCYLCHACIGKSEIADNNSCWNNVGLVMGYCPRRETEENSPPSQYGNSKHATLTNGNRTKLHFTLKYRRQDVYRNTHVMNLSIPHALAPRIDPS